MKGRERGFLLLSSHLGDPQRRPLSTAQMQELAKRVQGMEPPDEPRELRASDLTALGYGREMAERILALLDEEDVLDHYLRRGTQAGCVALSRVSDGYPGVLCDRLAQEAPGCLWAKGNCDLLLRPMVALVGSRDIHPGNLRFAQEVGFQAARQGFVLVSGNARGADRAAQQACLAAGGQVVSVVADTLERYPARENILYLSEDVFDGAFSALRALSRNRVIHCLGSRVFVAQCGLNHGGTWDGTVKNLRQGWSPVFCFDDGSEATRMLVQMGADSVGLADLLNIAELEMPYLGFFDQ